MLGMMPYTNRQLRVASNKIHYTVLTSGFTAVTNHFVIDVLKDTLNLIMTGRIEMLEYPDFFRTGYDLKLNKDVYHFLDSVAARDEAEKRRGLCHRIVRALVGIYRIKNTKELISTIEKIILFLRESYDGSINPPQIQKLKGMIREFEEELVWAHFGVQVENVHHLRLGFYTGEIFTENPEKERDMMPILNEFRKYRPSIISLALDPEGSGPDTHYKVLQAIAGAIKEWKKEEDLSTLRILGYRNVWFRFHPCEVNMIVPVSLNSLDILNSSFSDCYLSQVDASFPSYEYDGKFSELTQKIWVQQLKQVQLLLGKNYFYQNDLPLIRATHGIIYLKEMNADEFISMARDLEKVTEGIIS
jgi:glucosamine-6-phosphate deaminase